MRSTPRVFIVMLVAQAFVKTSVSLAVLPCGCARLETHEHFRNALQKVFQKVFGGKSSPLRYSNPTDPGPGN